MRDHECRRPAALALEIVDHAGRAVQPAYRNLRQPDSFDDLNRPVRSEDPLGNVTSRAYDEAGNLLCEKRPLGGDPLGRDQAAGLSVADVGVREAVSLRSEQSTRLHRPRWTLLSASGLGAGSSSDLYRGLHLYPLGSR